MTHPLTPREKVVLKPCPFCGGEAVAGSNFDNDHYVMCGADCDRCGGMVGYMKTEMAAIESWNRRTSLASGSGDHAELARLKAAMSKSNDEICQSLGKALGYPWFKDDQRNFPGATDENGVCVGEHVAESIADEAASRISALLAEITALWETNTEAERRLAEAEETNTRWAIRFAELRKAAGIGVKPMLSEVPGELRKMRSLLDRAAELMRQCTDPERFEGASTLNVYANMRAWLSDLSKEAERG